MQALEIFDLLKNEKTTLLEIEVVKLKISNGLKTLGNRFTLNRLLFFNLRQGSKPY